MTITDEMGQTDLIGYENGPNWYNYVGGDPINSIDPSVLDPMTEYPDIVVTVN